MITVCDKKGVELAVVLETWDYIQRGDTAFFSDPKDSIQIGSLLFLQDSVVLPHIHKAKDAERLPMEILLLFQGRVEVDIYNNERELAGQLLLKPGDILIQKSGGHGFRFPVKATLLEVKLGPYDGRESDKEMI